MKKLILAASTALLSAQALACPLSESLADRYGISFSGFKTPIPEFKGAEPGSNGSFVRVRVPDNSNVSDGFHHAVVLDLTTKKAWILRTGGFASVYQWYGPVDVINPSIENCQLEPTVNVVQGPQKR
jgi:hypothetical protein